MMNDQITSNMHVKQDKGKCVERETKAGDLL